MSLLHFNILQMSDNSGEELLLFDGDDTSSITSTHSSILTEKMDTEKEAPANQEEDMDISSPPTPPETPIKNSDAERALSPIIINFPSPAAKHFLPPLPKMKQFPRHRPCLSTIPQGDPWVPLRSTTGRIIEQIPRDPRKKTLLPPLPSYPKVQNYPRRYIDFFHPVARLKDPQSISKSKPKPLMGLKLTPPPIASGANSVPLGPRPPKSTTWTCY